VPGQREHFIMTERLNNGIPIHPAVWSELQDLHSRLTTPAQEDS
jgi:LDH2 family malate/lactate/ureidoglycolate dehydrogenase